jgi:hypothetical protein
VHLLAKACYDPDANITMLQKLEKAQQQQGVEAPPELLSTHPLTQVRGDRLFKAGQGCSGLDYAWCMVWWVRPGRDYTQATTACSNERTVDWSACLAHHSGHCEIASQLRKNNL